MNGNQIDDETRRFLAEASSVLLPAAAPSPTARLAALFAQRLEHTHREGDVIGTPVSTGTTSTTRRRITMVREMWARFTMRLTAAVVGASVAVGGLGMAGALTGPMQLINEVTSGESAEVSGADSSDAEPVGDVEGSLEDAEASTEPEVEVDDEGQGDEGDASPNPVSVAAKVHEFDEACGNHGTYVSWVARHGEEPECATGAPVEGGDGEGPAGVESMESVDSEEGSDKPGKGAKGAGKRADVGVRR